MWNIHKIKLTIFGVIIIGILAFQISGEVLIHFKNERNDLILVVARLLSGFLAVLFTIRFSLIVRIFLGSSFISGRYNGESTDSSRRNHIEKLRIKQSLLHTELTGKSFDNTGNIVCTYKGTLFKEDNEVFEFIVEMTSKNSKQKEWGLLTLNVSSDFDRKIFNFKTWFKRKSIQLDGFYNSLDNANHNIQTSTIKAIKI